MNEKVSIKKNYIYNVAYQVLNLLAPLVTTPYISRVLGVEGVGEYSYTSSVVTYFITLAILGSTPYAQREVSYLREDKEKYSILFWEIVVFRGITVLISCLLFSIVIILSEPEIRIIYMIQGLNIVAVAFDISWFFQGLEEFKKIVIRNVFIKILNILLIFILVKQETDIWKYVLIIAGLTVVGNIFIWGGIKRYINKVSIKSINIKQHLIGILQLFLPTIAVSIYRALDKTMIGLVTTTTTENGYYEQADKIIQMCIVVTTSLSTVMAPRIALTLSKKDNAMLKKYMYKTFDFLLLISLPMAMGIIVVSDMIVPWFFGSGYEKVGLIIKIFSPLMVVVTFSNAIGMQYLIQARKQKIYTISICTGAIVNFIINLVLIPRLYSIGAAVASVVAESAILIVQMWYVCNKKQILDIKGIFSKFPIYMGMSTVMFVILMIIKRFMAPNFVSSFCIVIIGISIYTYGLWIVKDEWILKIVIMLSQKIKK